MNFDDSEQIDSLGRLPPVATPPPSRSAWGAVPRGVGGGAAKLGAGVAESLKVRPDLSKAARNWERTMRPDPATAGEAEKIVYGLSSVLTELAAGAVVAGPLGAAGAAGLAEGTAAVDDLQRQGVDNDTAYKAGAVTGAVTGAGAVLPVFGSTIGKTVGLWALGGPASFMGQTAATSAILSRADYDELAKQYDPFDPMGLALSAIPGAPFALFHGWRLAKGAPAAKPGAVAGDRAPVDTTAPPEPAAASREAVDAALVHNLTLQGDLHEAKVGIPRADALAPADRAIEDQFADKLARDYPAAVAEYATRPDASGGKVLNVDTARELSPEYMADRTRSASVHEPASWFIKRLYADRLAGMKGDSVVFTSGGTGAGKTTGIADVPAAKALVDDAGLVYDTNMNSLGSAVQKIEQALKAGVANVHIFHVQRDPVEALVKGALPRAMRQEAEFGSGRTVPLVEHARTHRGAAEVIQQIAEKYKDDPRVSVHVIDNTHGKGGSRPADLGFIRGFDYNGLEGKLNEALRQEHDAGRISGAVFRATQGDAGEGVGAVLRAAVREQPEPQRAGAGPQGPGKAAAKELTLPAEASLAKQTFEAWGGKGELADWLHEAEPTPTVNNLVIGLSEAKTPERGEAMLADYARTRAARPGMKPEDVAADVVEAAREGRTVTEAELTNTPEAPKPQTDALMQSVSDRVAEVEKTAGDMVIGHDADGKPITVADELARIRREVAEGTDTELGTLDADLVRVATECALSLGAV